MSGSDGEIARGGYVPKESGHENEVAAIDREKLEPVSGISAHGYEANDLLKDFQKNYVKIVELSHYLADKVGILKSAIRVYSTFTYGDIRLEGGTKKNRTLIEKFIKKTKLNKTVRDSIPDLYKAGNIFWYREKENGKTVWVHQFNPIDVEVKGHSRGKPIAKFKSNNDRSTLPDDLGDGYEGYYDLKKNQIYQCAFDKEGYLRYGKPITTPTFEPIQHIEALMDMEKKSIDQVVESLMVVTLGDKDRPAGKEQIQELKRHVQNLHSVSRLVGNHTLKVELIEKDVSVFQSEKFEVPMKMLLQSIGITPSIFTGEGSYATATAGMSSAKKTIENARQEIIDTLEEIFEDVAIEAGLDPTKNPDVTLGRLDLNEEKVQHQMLRNLYLDGIISAETYGVAHGHILEHEQRKIEEEKKYNIEARQMSSTLSKSGDGDGKGRPEGDTPTDKQAPSDNPKPSTS
jgi:hypothetical protein